MITYGPENSALSTKGRMLSHQMCTIRGTSECPELETGIGVIHVLGLEDAGTGEELLAMPDSHTVHTRFTTLT